MAEIREQRSFISFWTTWRKYLNAMVDAKGAKLLCPASENIKFAEIPNGFTAKPKWPICFQALPQKGNSTTANHKLVVFIDGSFTFLTNAANPPEIHLVGVDSNVAFFKPKSEGKGISLELLDAYHFDHFVEDPKLSIPHPIFHAQRNIRGDDLFPQFTESLNSDPNNSMVIGNVAQEQKNALFGLKTFRLPTPQIDLFSLSAIIAADHLVDKCSHDSTPYKNFKAFLKCIGEHKPNMVHVRHQPPIRANAADADNRFVWQWYSTH
nr:hypothetical protein [uncultured Rhodoferax sp.]